MQPVMVTELLVEVLSGLHSVIGALPDPTSP